MSVSGSNDLTLGVALDETELLLWTTMRVFEEQAIAVVGTSYGAYLATILTSLRPVRWLALRAPAIYKDEGWKLPKRQLHQDPDLPAYRRHSLARRQRRFWFTVLPPLAWLARALRRRRGRRGRR